jgi:hypothetical protein
MFGPLSMSYMTHDLTKLSFTIVDRVLRLSSKPLPFENNAHISHFREVNTTIPTQYSSDGFMRLSNLTGTMMSEMFSQNGTATVEMAYPVVITQCRQQFSSLDSEAKIYYEPDAATLTSFSTLGALAKEISNSSEVVQDSCDEYYAPLWGQSPQPGSTSSFALFLSRALPHTNRSDSSSSYVNTSYSLSSLLGDTNGTFDHSTIEVIGCKLSAF